MDGDIDHIMYQGELLEELWIEIFIRLSVRALLIVGCVCKQWQALIYNRSFQKKHLELQKKNSWKMGCFILRHLMDEDLSHDTIIYPLVDEEYIADNDYRSSPASLFSRSYSILNYENLESHLCIEGSINGLYCVHNGKDRFVIWNPATSEAGFLPFPKCFSDASDVVRVVAGFGTDPLNEEDYKVLLICEYNDISDRIKFCRMLYSTRTNTWRLVDDDNFVGSGDPFNYSSNNTYLNGNYYVLAENERVALSFDMGEKEAFQSVSLPKLNPENNECHVDLVLHDDHINLFIVKEELSEIDIWILMVEKNNWIKKISISLGLQGVKKSLGFWRTGDELIIVTNDFEGYPRRFSDSRTALYNTRTQEVTFISPTGEADDYKAVFYYESFVSLSGGITKYKENPASVIDEILDFLDSPITL